MAIDLAELNVAPDGQGAAPGAEGELMYYRKPMTFPDGETPMPTGGWIIWGEANDKEMVRLSRNKGFTPLHKYGRFDHSKGKVSVVNHPYYYILQHPTGPAEFPVNQIVELGWHRKPPYGVKFPQLEGVKVTEVMCGICRKVFQSLDPAEATINLRKHESVMHRDDAQNQNLARVLASAQKDIQGPMGEVLTALVQQLEHQAKAQEQQGQVLAALLAKMNEKGKG